MLNYTCVKHPRTQFEVLCLWYANEFSGTKHVYIVDESGNNTFIGLVRYAEMSSERYCKAIKPLNPDYMFCHADSDKYDSLWFGAERKQGVLDVMEAALNSISDTDKRLFKIQYSYDEQTHMILKREAGKFADPECLKNAEQLERDAQRIKARVFDIKPEKTDQQITDEFVEISKDPVFNGDLQRKEVRSVNEAVQRDWDDQDEFNSYLDDLEG